MNHKFLTSLKNKHLLFLFCMTLFAGLSSQAQSDCADSFPQDLNSIKENALNSNPALLIPSPSSHFRRYGLNEADQRFWICSNPECSKINQAKSMITFHQLDKNGYGPYLILVFDRRTLYVWTEASGVVTSVDQNTLDLIHRRLQTLKKDPQYTTELGQRAFDYMMTNHDINPIYSNH